MVEIVDARSVRLADLKALWTGFIRESAEADPWWHAAVDLDRAADRFLLAAADRADNFFVVATDGGVPAGYVYAERHPVRGVFQAPDYVHVSDLYVAPEHRRKGIAQRLMQEVEQWTRAQGLSVIELNVLQDNPARRLYQRLGFRAHRTILIRRLD